VHPLGKLGVRAIERGSASSVRVGENVVMAGHGGTQHSLKATVFASASSPATGNTCSTKRSSPRRRIRSGRRGADRRRRQAPRHRLAARAGKVDASTLQGNMIVPIDILAPVLDDMVKLAAPTARRGRGSGSTSPKPVRASSSPASRPRVQPRRRASRSAMPLLEIAGAKPAGLADLFRRTWACGAVGARVPLRLLRETTTKEVVVTSADRNDFLKKPHLH